MEKDYVSILDIRQPYQVLSKLNNHKNCVNAISWAPESSIHICSAGDDR